MGSKKKSAKKIKLEEEEDASNSSIKPISDDEEEANKDLSLEIINKALLKTSTNPQNAAVLNAPEVIAASNEHSEEIKLKKRKKKKKKKKLESEIEAAVIVEEEEKKNVESIEVAEKVEHSKAEIGVVDMSDNVVLRNTDPESRSEEIKTQKKKKKKKNHEPEIQTAVIAEVEEVKEPVETIEDPEKVEPGKAETCVVNTSENVVLRKLLRGPRYFDPPSESVWGTCFNCGEEGHASFNCTAPRRKKPCFICGSLSHNVKKCTMARYCSTCKEAGHRSKDCPKKNTDGSNSKSLTLCLRCGNSGHEMFLCKNDYSQDDLKEIQCYICKKFGHLCCVNTTEAMPKDFSCYRCGQMGHIGWACSRLQNEATDAATPSSCYKCGEKGHFARECSSSVKVSSRWQSESNGPVTPSSCYRCGEEGHFSRECPSSAKVSSRWQSESNGPVTPSSCYRCGEEGHFSRECPSSAKVYNKNHKLSETPRSQEENGYVGHGSAHHDNGNASKRTRPYMEESDIKTPKRSKHRGGWMTEHPGEFSPSNSIRDSWRSPVTPCTNNSTHNRYFNNGSHTPNSIPYMGNGHDGTPNSEGSARTFHHGYSASRFGNSSSNGFQRNDGFQRNYNDGFQRNYNDGFQRNYNGGFQRNYDNGFQRNYDDGFQRNYNDGFQRNYNGGFQRNYNEW